MRILVCGLPGSGKTTLARRLVAKLRAIHFNADDIRAQYNDWDFSLEGRWRQVYRMKTIGISLNTMIFDFVAPLLAIRDFFDADITIWLDTIDQSRYADTNALFEPVVGYDFRIDHWLSDIEIDELAEQLKVMIS